ncbi:hypothetical protein [Arthrobacter gengyunqii]|uniref:ATP-binding protein n=1 Tax=Arthrobacter gengyunqii TaxID=2886940 RepID=A0ABS8GHH2_9MICC|nr:hypothetical protein [Arthrobacter gengyunqii]MCC3265896.1 hypothetical protein [Arthrobacter gengyunqii]
MLSALDVDHALTPVNADPSLNEIALVELSQFSSSGDIDSLVSIVFNNEIPAELKSVICRALIETGNNVPEHARVEHGYMAAQVNPSVGTLRIAVADSGVGLLTTLAPRGATSDREALQMAISGTSEKDSLGAGRGLSGTSQALKAHRGVGMLLSGTTSMTMTQARDAPWQHREGFQGTVFGAQLALGEKR